MVEKLGGHFTLIAATFCIGFHDFCFGVIIENTFEVHEGYVACGVTSSMASAAQDLALK